MAATLELRYADVEHRVIVLDDGRVQIGEAIVGTITDATGAMRIDGPRTVRAWATATRDASWVFLAGRAYRFEVVRAGARRRRGGGHHGTLSSPMPATVRRIAVAAGDTVRRGDTLIVLEAMKMELPIRATADGVIESVSCREGELVQPGVPLIDIDERDGI
jgi:biotin carboxyl carrier protein